MKFFIYFHCITYFWSLSLDVVDFDNLEELEDQDFEQQAGEQGRTLSSKQESKASDPWPCWTRALSLSSSHYCLHVLIWLHVVYPSSFYLDTFRIWVYAWVDLLSPAVMSYELSYKSSIFYDVEFGLWFSMRVLLFHPSWCELTVVGLMLCFEQCLGWWRWLSPSRDVVNLAQIC
jgi:hypothetical protein